MGFLTDILKGLPENALLRSKVAEAEERYGALETKNAILKDDLRNAKAEIKQLEKQIQEFTHDYGLSKIEVEILLYFADPHVLVDVEMLLDKLQIHPARLQHYIENLEERGFLVTPRDMFGNQLAMLELLPKGRAYLVEQGLI